MQSENSMYTKSSLTSAAAAAAMMCPQCLFRSNGAAILLSNKAADVKRAKYTIRNIVRTNMAADDVAYNCVVQVSNGRSPHHAAAVPTTCSTHLNLPCLQPWSWCLADGLGSACQLCCFNPPPCPLLPHCAD